MSVVETQTQPGGDASARFTALFRATHGDLVRFVRARCPRDRVDDVVAETFLTAWRRFDRLPDDDGAARAWLFVTARNLLLNDSRREGRREHLPLLIELGEDGNGSGELVERRTGGTSRGITRRSVADSRSADDHDDNTGDASSSVGERETSSGSAAKTPSGTSPGSPLRRASDAPPGSPPRGAPWLDDEVAFRLDLAAALRSLSDADQEVLGLAVVDGLTPAEAGVVLGISANTYAARLSRARKRLAAALARSPEASGSMGPQAAISNRAAAHQPTTASPPLRAAAPPGSRPARPPAQARAIQAPIPTKTKRRTDASQAPRPTEAKRPSHAPRPTDFPEPDGTDTFRSTP